MLTLLSRARSRLDLEAALASVALPSELEVESEKCLGVQRVRCYPFSWDKFNKRNWSQFVGIVPPKKYSGIAFRDYDLSKAEHRREMWELTSFHVVYVDILPPSAGSIRECLMDPHGIH